MISKIKELWNDKGFEIILGLCIAFILIYALYSKIVGNKGTWSDKKDIFNNPLLYNTTSSSYEKPISNRSPPKESKGELECRRVLESIFKKPFNKERPDFLRNPVTGGDFNLELDCYNHQLKIALEYNGAQHYQYIPYFHKNKEAFMNQKYRDDMKRRMCKDNGILLIEVPHTIKIENIRSFIEKELNRKLYGFNK